MTTEQSQAWLDAYVAAWRPYDRPAIEALFTADARYAYATGDVFSNLFELEFAPDGRCSSFVEWYLHHPKA